MRTIADSEQLRALTELLGAGRRLRLHRLRGGGLARAARRRGDAGDDGGGPQVERLGEEVAARIASWLAETGVDLLTEAELAEIAIEPSGSLARFEDGREREADARRPGARDRP